MVEVTLEWLIGTAVAVAAFLAGYLRNMRHDICKDINAKHMDLKQDISEVKENTKLSKEEQEWYHEIHEKIERDLEQRLSRLEGQNIERDRSAVKQPRNSGQH